MSKLRKSYVRNKTSWKTILDFTKIDARGIPADEILAALRTIKSKK